MNEAKRAANKRHAAKLDQLKVQPPEEVGAKIRQAAKDAGESVQGYILTAVKARMDAESGETIRISVPREQIQPLADAAGMTAKEYLAHALQDALTK